MRGTEDYIGMVCERERELECERAYRSGPERGVSGSSILKRRKPVGETKESNL